MYCTTELWTVFETWHTIVVNKTRYIYKYHIHKVNVRNRNKIERPVVGQVLLPRINAVLCFSLDGSALLWDISFRSWFRRSKHIERYWCCMCGHCFSRVFRKEKRIAALPMNGTKLNRPNPCNRRLTLYHKWSDRARRAGLGWVPWPVFSSALNYGSALIITFWL
jgi:hypothetical protein